MFSRTAERVLNSAAREAVTRRHAHLTLEHLLFAILGEPSGEKILRAAGADTTRLKAELETVLSDTLDTLPPGGRLVVQEPGPEIQTADELKAELERGLRVEASDFNPTRVFRPRK